MAHVAAGDHRRGEVAARGGGGDRLAEQRFETGARVIERDHDRRSPPSGFGEEPQRHDAAVVERGAADVPRGQAGGGCRGGDRVRQRFVVRQVDLRFGRAEARERPLQAATAPQAERLAVAWCMRRDQDQRVRASGNDGAADFAHRLDGGGDLAATLATYAGTSPEHAAAGR